MTGGFGGTDWSSGKLWASLVFLVLGAEIVTYVGFYLALAQWSSAPRVCVDVPGAGGGGRDPGAAGEVPGALATAGLAIVITGVAIVTHPRAEATQV